MTPQRKKELCDRYFKFVREAEKEENAGNISVAHSIENRMAKIEEELYRNDVDLNDYRP